MLLKNRNFVILIVVLLQCVSSIHTQTIDDIVGNIPSEESTIEEVSNIYGIDMLPGARSFVNGITASADISGEYITVSWNGIIDSEVTYYLYRSMEPALDSAILDNAKLISSINSSDSYSTLYSINDTLDRSGSYYYAVVAELNNVAKFYTATAGVDMTITPVLVNEVEEIFSGSNVDTNTNIKTNANVVAETTLNDLEYVTSITASIKSSSESMLYWGEVPGYNGLYVVYKNSIPIENAEILSESVAIGRTPDVFFNDTNVTMTYGPPYYYVTLENWFQNPVFRANDNYTTRELVLIEEIKESDIVVIEDDLLDTPFITNGMDNTDTNTTEVVRALVTELATSREGKNVRLNWSITNNLPDEYHYILISSTNEFDTNSNVMNNSAVIGITKLSDSDVSFGYNNDNYTYLDTPIPSLHKYNPIYYALALIQNNEIPIVYPSDGMYTTSPIIIEKPKTVIIEEPKDDIVITNESKPLIVMPIEEKKEDVSGNRNVSETYNKAVVLFKERKYSEASELLELIQNYEANSRFNYQINLLLGRSYYKLGKKKNALDTFRSVYDFSPSEIDFWIAQVLSDL